MNGKVFHSIPKVQHRSGKFNEFVTEAELYLWREMLRRWLPGLHYGSDRYS